MFVHYQRDAQDARLHLTKKTSSSFTSVAGQFAENYKLEIKSPSIHIYHRRAQ